MFKRISIQIVLVCAAFGVTSTVEHAPSSAGTVIPAQKSNELITNKVTLDNGLTVLITEMPASTTVSLFALVKTGSATEGRYTGTGISHFMEHMLFKGHKNAGSAKFLMRSRLWAAILMLRQVLITLFIR